MSETAPLSLRQKLIRVYELIDFVPKDGENKTQGYDYVKALHLVTKVRKALLALNVYTQVEFEQIRAYEYKTRNGSTMNAVDVKCTVTFIDGDAILINGQSGEKYIAVGLGSAADAGDKYSYKAQTGALKYALRNAFLIPDEADPEGDESVDEPEERPAPKQKSIKQTSPAASKASEPAAEEKSAPVSAGSLAPMTEEEVGEQRNKFRGLGDELAAAGLKAAAKLPINRKLLAYLLQTTGANDAGNISRTQWATFWNVVNGVKKSDGGIKELVRLVDAAAKPKKQSEEEAA